MAELVRLNKYISESGMCSRREADKYIENGQVRINGKKVEIGMQIDPFRDRVMVNGNVIEPKRKEDMIIMAFNKPIGITTTTEHGVKDSVVGYIGYHERIFPIGRLDKDSQGLLFMTNNGDIVNKILRAGNSHEKEYVVTVDKLITSDFIEKMGVGVPILGTMTKKCKVVQEAPYVFRITLVQGLNRQIRRMCEYFGYDVVKLERVRIMNVSLKGLGLGEWKILSGRELDVLNAMIAESSSEDGGRREGAGKPVQRSQKGANPSVKKNETKSTSRTGKSGGRSQKGSTSTYKRITVKSSGGGDGRTQKRAGGALQKQKGGRR